MDQEEELGWGAIVGGCVQNCEDSMVDMMMMGGGGGGGGRDSASSQFESCYIDSALPSDSDHAYDHHSSEEELEVINSSFQEVDDIHSDNILGDVDVDVDGDGDGDGDGDENGDGEDEIRGGGCENKRKWSQVAANRLSVESTSSSDDEVQGLLRPLSTPVEFCTSPPVDVHKPSRSQSPPPKLFLFCHTHSPPLSSATSSTNGGGGGGGGEGAQTSSVSPSSMSIMSTSSSHQSSMSVPTRVTSMSMSMSNPCPASSTTSSPRIPGGGGGGGGCDMVGVGGSLGEGGGGVGAASIPGGALINGGLSGGVFRGIRRYDRHSNLIESNHPYSMSSLGNSHSSSSHLHETPAAALATQQANSVVSSTEPQGQQQLHIQGHGPGVQGQQVQEGVGGGVGLGGRHHSLPSPLGHHHHHHISSHQILGGIGSGSGRSGLSGRGSSRDSTSRKRHRHHNPRHIQRPWLDFEKMQQLKTRSVTTWRSGGELSLYCS